MLSWTFYPDYPAYSIYSVDFGIGAAQDEGRGLLLAEAVCPALAGGGE